MSLQDLARFSADNPASPAAKKAKVEWTPPVAADFADGDVIAIDQTLAHTGVVALSHYAGNFIVRDAASWHIERDGASQGHEDSLRRTLRLREYLEEFCVGYRELGWVIRHELPIPLKTNPKINRPESALLAAVAVRVVAADLSLPVADMMGAQTHKRITCGKPNADKIEHHSTLLALAGNLGIVGMECVTNEGKRDSLSIALAHLHQEAGRG